MGGDARARGEPTVGAAGAAEDVVVRLIRGSRLEVLPTKGAEAQLGSVPAGATITVTSSPRKGIEGTLAVAERLRARGHSVVPHLAARLISDRAELTAICRRLADSDLREAFVIGGDAATPAGRYDSAGALLRDLVELDERPARIGIGGYPEGHPFMSAGEAVAALQQKAPLVDYIVTQICFEPAVVASWLRTARSAGIGLPVYVGIPGPVERRKLLEISLRVGVGDSVRFLRKQGTLVARLLRRRDFEPDPIVDEVVRLVGRPGGFDASDLLGFHVYTFNQIERTARWLSDRLGETDPAA